MYDTGVPSKDAIALTFVPKETALVTEFCINGIEVLKNVVTVVYIEVLCDDTGQSTTPVVM